MIGRTLAHYEITGMLGSGGMGEVYRARDTRLKRDVALKVLPSDMRDPARLERFQREAETVAQLSHPHIVTLFSVEEADGLRFLTMELIEGRSLHQIMTEDGLPVRRIYQIGIAVADALASAHAKGIVHRDLKPGNIMITDEGRVKVLDFGLAKLGEEAAPTADTVMPLTRDGAVLGTVPYMSPEQLRGQEVDARSDIFSLGTLLYEAAVGRRPFAGESDSDEMSSILRDTPTPLSKINPEIPDPLGRLVARCLEKDVEHRYQSAADVRDELEELRVESTVTSRSIPPVKSSRRLWPLFALGIVLLTVFLWQVIPKDSGPPDSAISTSTGGSTIVVFPFENLGSDEDGYFADGVVDEIISRLTAVEGIGVISRTTALGYNREGKSLEEIAEDLGVDLVLEGTIRWDRSSGDVSRVRITPQLVSTKDGVGIWSSTFDRDLVDIFDIQAEIASQVVGSIDASLIKPAGEVRAPGTPTSNLKAYDHYLRSREFTQWGMGPAEADLVQGVFLLEKAVALDPDFAAAHASLSRAHSAMFFRDYDKGSKRVEQSRQAADRALELAPDLAEAHLAKALFHSRTDRDYPAALGELELARQLAPGNGEILSWIGTVRKRQGKFTEAAEILKRALELDPRNPTVLGELAVVYKCLGDYEAALAFNERGIELNPTLNSKYFRAGIILAKDGDWTAYRELLEAEKPSPDVDGGWIAQLEREGDIEGALARLDPMLRDADLTPERSADLLVQKGRLLWLLGDRRGAGIAAARAVVLLEEESERDSGHFIQLALAHALQGRREESSQAIAQAWQDPVTTRDMLAQHWFLEELAEIQVILGDHEHAVGTLEKRLEGNAQLSVRQIETEPRWDPLRDRADFQALMQRHAR